MNDHIRRYVETDGAEGHEWRPGVHTLLLTTKGRKSGEPRRTALIYRRHGDAVVVVASSGGAPKHPAWYLNLETNSEAEVQVGPEKYQVRARTAEGEERAELWKSLNEVWPDYANYQTKTDREIPVVVLDRV
ncbi:nitroreductase family deazaflavin-dependent oxidoreductase [Saccharothrix violaceirubra]|uniref:Deazaflavin-dependent oxidoreductase (Nitroreductase family) n=1 Tax=Saccharothrix violaceirubra TaxID=413306 RepID=A0A7W7T8Y3_9PSEU|nr:nitroreductase family deazaflavin-dependent oxidoreductase [Saccharothrix violaceirubra]MBB4968680.1 deazaflavin-dependent oxidoreductase (nitroreductase family) [Saccharothrix violaceirubra]